MRTYVLKAGPWTESVWKSLAVKALRIGWPTGLRMARRNLSRSTMRSLMTCGVFEDVFPTESDMPAVVAAINAEDWDALCQFDTHHGRGYSEDFCDLEEHAVPAAKNYAITGALASWGKSIGLWLPPRSMNCVWTWKEVAPFRGGMRELDTAEWRDMPTAIVDGHTREGKIRRTNVTLLSGHYSQHRVIGRRVQAEGWEAIRRETHQDHLKSQCGQGITRDLFPSFL